MLSRRGFVAGLTATAVLAAAGCSSNTTSDTGTNTTYDTSLDEGILKSTFFNFDTVIDLSVYGDQSVLDAAQTACQRYEELFSMQLEGTDVWRINHAAGAPTEVDPDTADLIGKALEFCEASSGAFDITIGTVSQLWDFEEGVKPDDSTIQAAIPHINWKNVQVEGNTVTLLDPETAIDLGGIAKGWIADALAQLYRDNGVTSGLINLGGNVYALGTKPSGKLWTIGLRDPNVSDGAAVATLSIDNKSVVTSGLYERHFELDGVDYYHILDPKTGYPAITDLRADTIISDLSLDGDGLSTTAFIFGSSDGMDFVESRGDIDAVFMLEDGSTVFSTNIDQYNYQVL